MFTTTCGQKKISASLPKHSPQRHTAPQNPGGAFFLARRRRSHACTNTLIAVKQICETGVERGYHGDMCICICIHVCKTCTCVYLYVYIYTHTHTHYIYIYTHIYIYLYYSICMYLQYHRFVIIVFEPTMLWVNIRLLISTSQRNMESPVGASDRGNNMCWPLLQ